MNRANQTPTAKQLIGRASLLAGVLLTPSFAQALACGDTVSSSVTLSADLLDCPDVGLRVAYAAGVRINLNGHRITGAPGSSAGISVVEGHKVIVEGGGAISGFDAGVAVNDSSKVSISRLRFFDNRANDVYLRNVTASVVRDNRMHDSRMGVIVDGPGVSMNNLITRNTFMDQYQGVYIRGGDDNRVISNTMRDNQVGVGIASGSGNLVEGNGIHSNVNGVVISNGVPGGSGAHDNRVVRNKIYDNTIGLIATGSSGGYLKYNLVDRNTFRGGQTGIELSNKWVYGTTVSDNGLYDVAGDAIVDNGTATGLAGNSCSPGPC
jgi:parallel beta-helix repeat protein